MATLKNPKVPVQGKGCPAGFQAHKRLEVASKARILRRFLSNEIPSRWSFRPSSMLRQPLHSPLGAGCRALNTNQNPPQSGTSFSGNRLSSLNDSKNYRDGVFQGPRKPHGSLASPTDHGYF